MSRRSGPAAQRRRVEQWTSPVGVRVIYTRDDGSETTHVTRGVAALLSGHTAVILLEGVSGFVALERVRLA